MDPEQLPLLMMLIFLMIIIISRVAFQFIAYNDTGVRSGTKLRSKKEMSISFLMFGVVGVQTLLAWLYASSRLKPQLEFGLLPVGIGLAFCVIGIAFSSYAQHKMGKEWRIGVDPNEKTELVTTGIYKFIRNPIYTGCIVHGIGLIILAPHLLFLITGLVGYFAVRAYVKDVEEPYLIEIHGDKYRQYMSQTGPFFPRFIS